MKKFTKKLAALLICVITVFTTLAPTAFAAGKTISGTSAKEVTLTVVTGNKETGSWLLGKYGNYITFKPKAGIANRVCKLNNKKSTSRMYCQFMVFLTTESGTTTWNSFSDDDYKIKLSPNSTYKITIRPVTDWYFAQFSIANFWIYKDWKKDASWTISKQLGIKSITVNK